MLQDGGVNILLVSGKESIGLETGCNIVDINEDGIYSKEATNIEVNNKSDNLAYVMYTSGSTGMPKGVKTTVITSYSIHYTKLYDGTVKNIKD